MRWLIGVLVVLVVLIGVGYAVLRANPIIIMPEIPHDVSLTVGQDLYDLAVTFSRGSIFVVVDEFEPSGHEYLTRIRASDGFCGVLIVTKDNYRAGPRC